MFFNFLENNVKIFRGPLAWCYSHSVPSQMTDLTAEITLVKTCHMILYEPFNVNENHHLKRLKYIVVSPINLFTFLFLLV